MWCYDDRKLFFNDSQGQISPYGDVGKLIIDLCKKNNLKNIIDIGTWNGLGSTRCFLLGLENNNTTKLFSLEANKDKNIIAKENLNKLGLLRNSDELYWGSILKEEDIINIDTIFPEFLQHSELQRWHSIDVENMKLSPYLMDIIPEEIDFVLFDGGEFTTYYEFQKLFPRCTKYIALDDVNASKCNKIYFFLKEHTDWEEVAYIEERGHFALFIHK